MCSIELGDSVQDTPVTVKLRGDGACFSSTSSFVLLSFSFPHLSSNALSASGMVKFKQCDELNFVLGSDYKVCVYHFVYMYLLFVVVPTACHGAE